MCHLPDRVHSKGIWCSVPTLLGRGINHVCFPAQDVFVGLVGVPRGPEDVDGLGEDVVVDQTCVDGEHGHKRDKITSSKENFPDFRINFSRFQLLFLDAHPQAKGKNHQAMAGVTKHDGKKEGKGDYGKNGRISLAIRSNSIGVNEFLEGRSKLVCSKEGWRRLLGCHLVEYRRDS